jgi:two-component system, OmpR family, sensor histidine kinase KdpD
MDTERRPDPDALLARIVQDEAQAQRGRLKIFFGASAGVGKTYAMLSAAQAARAQGVDLVIGVVETHGRAETEALVAGIERLPLKALAHRDRTLKEFDLDAALARKPELVLVDELAHSTVQGSRHPKRWHDVSELLDAGISVWTTMNVQHLESLNDIVGGITGVRVWETVPDHVFDKADEVVIVDLSPDDLLQRLKEGKVYMPHQAEQAVRNFFRKGNLIALRELALRRTADRVDDQMLAYRQRGGVPTVWGTRESLLACVGPGEHGEKTVRSTARLADQLDVPWHAVYVETPALQRLPDARRKNVLRTLKLAQDLGATTATLTGNNPAETIVKYARQHNLAKIVLGRGDRPRRWPWQRVLADHVGMLGSDLDVIQIALPAARRAAAPTEPAEGKSRPVRWDAYAKATALCVAMTLIATPLLDVFEVTNIVMLFLLAVLLTAVRYGRGPAVLASFLSVASFDFFFVPPRFTFAVADVQYLLTFVVMLIVALVIGQMAGGLTYQARVAQRREERMRALYEMSRDLSAALMREQVAEIGGRFLAGEFNARAAVLVAGDDDQLGEPMAGGDAPEIDRAIAQWSFDKHEPAGHGTDTLPASPVLYLPLTAPMRVRGVLAIQPRDPTRLAVPEQRRLLDTCASLLAISLERIHYVEVAQGTTVQMESERLRNSLLAAISHDLRTPLASLVGLAETMTMARATSPDAQAETAHAIREAALRMSALVNNLLDMARLESGAVHLNRQWLPLEEVIGSARKALAPTLQGRPVPVSLPADVPLVHVDAVLIERVLVNLLENAAKYTPPGTPIEIGATASGDAVELHVDDRGPGLPRGREEAIFRKFERGQKESATPGVGLGLAISRSIAEAHGGSLRAANREAGGARFTLRLPRGEPPSIETVPEAAQHE